MQDDHGPARQDRRAGNRYQVAGLIVAAVCMATAGYAGAHISWRGEAAAPTPIAWTACDPGTVLELDGGRLVCRYNGWMEGTPIATFTPRVQRTSTPGAGAGPVAPQ